MEGGEEGRRGGGEEERRRGGEEERRRGGEEERRRGREGGDTSLALGRKNLGVLRT